MLCVEVELVYRCAAACDILLQIEVANTNHQEIADQQISVYPDQAFHRIASDENVGERIWLSIDDVFKCSYQARVNITRPVVDIASLSQTQLTQLEGGAVKYLLPSRYCHLDKFDGLLPDQLSELKGGALVVALAQWIEKEFAYLSTASNSLTTAHETFISRQGVCRDYAHVLISLLRVYGIPARMVSAYAPNVTPQDFHALVEVYLEGGWYLIDPTGMSVADEVAIIGVGRDAADISFLTSYGYLDLEKQTVSVSMVKPS